MICARCDQPIRPGQPAEELTVDAATSAGGVFHFHALPGDCDRPWALPGLHRPSGRPGVTSS